jgi:hypothetical protein
LLETLKKNVFVWLLRTKMVRSSTSEHSKCHAFSGAAHWSFVFQSWVRSLCHGRSGHSEISDLIYALFAALAVTFVCFRTSLGVAIIILIVWFSGRVTLSGSTTMIVFETSCQ